jgi:hypothetical protein
MDIHISDFLGEREKKKIFSKELLTLFSISNQKLILLRISLNSFANGARKKRKKKKKKKKKSIIMPKDFHFFFF